MADLAVPQQPDVPQKDEAGKPVERQKMFERFMAVQSQDLEVRKQEIEVRRDELELRKQESAQGFEFAQESLKIQAADLKEVRSQEKRESWQVLVILISVLLVVAGVIVYAINLNKDQFVLELARVILTALGGGGVGYVIGHKRASKSSDDSDSE